MTNFILPDYKEQSPEVKDRFKRLKERPVILSGSSEDAISNLTRPYISLALDESRITSYNVCYTKLLRIRNR